MGDNSCHIDRETEAKAGGFNTSKYIPESSELTSEAIEESCTVHTDNDQDYVPGVGSPSKYNRVEMQGLHCDLCGNL